MKMKQATTTLTFAVIGGLVLGWSALLYTHSAGKGRAPPPRALAAPSPATMNVPVRSSAVVPEIASGTPSIDYKKALNNAKDYWEFAHAALPAAKAGNADAQFYLSRVLEQCASDNKMFFIRRGVPLSLEEGFQWAAKRHLSLDLAQTIFDHCHQFLTKDATELGTASGWLADATKSGQPIAEATTAQKILVQELAQNFVRNGAVADDSPTPELNSGLDPRTLLRAAVTSKDPEVLFAIGEAQGLLNPGRDVNVARLAWLLVACQRGMDCTANGSLVKVACADDPVCQSAVSPTDLVESFAKDKWSQVQEQAQQISAELDAGQWDNLVPPPPNPGTTADN